MSDTRTINGSGIVRPMFTICTYIAMKLFFNVKNVKHNSTTQPIITPMMQMHLCNHLVVLSDCPFLASPHL